MRDNIELPLAFALVEASPAKVTYFWTLMLSSSPSSTGSDGILVSTLVSLPGFFALAVQAVHHHSMTCATGFHWTWSSTNCIRGHFCKFWISSRVLQSPHPCRIPLKFLLFVPAELPSELDLCHPLEANPSLFACI